MVADYVGQFAGELLDFFTRSPVFVRLEAGGKSHSVAFRPDIGRERLHRIYFPAHFKEFPQMSHRQRTAIGAAGFVPQIPEGDSPVSAVFTYKFLAHAEELGVQFRVVEHGIADCVRERTVLRLLASAMVSPIVVLHTGRRELPHFLRTRTIIPENYDGADFMFVHQCKPPLETGHESVVVCEPDAESLLVDDQAHHVEAGSFGEREFSIHFLEALFAAKLLPHVRIVRGTCRKVVAPAHPRLPAVPVPRPILRPGPGACGKDGKRQGAHGDQRYVRFFHFASSFRKTLSHRSHGYDLVGLYPGFPTGRRASKRR